MEFHLGPFGDSVVSMQDRHTVCAKCTIGSEIILTHPMEILGDVRHVESHFFTFGDSVSVSARLELGLR